MPDNLIVLENARTDGVTPRSVWDAASTDRIEGFATDISIDRGTPVSFKVNVNVEPGSTVGYSIEIYRLGYYGGDGARLVHMIHVADGGAQAAPVRDATTGLVDAGNWAISATWAVPADAVSGVYLAKLVRDDEPGGTNQIPFVVRADDGPPSDIVFQTSDTTWQAYNGWGGNNGAIGANFYGGDTDVVAPGFGSGRALAVSYNRPFTTRDGGGVAAGAQDYLFGAEYAAISWLEQNGYDVSYIAGVDTDRLGAEALLGHRAFLSVGHDEYWSGGQRANVEAARDAGVNLLFWSGNEVYWKVRFDASLVTTDGSPTAYRTLVGYKETWASASPAAVIDLDPTSNEWTGTWRDPRGNPLTATGGGRPENALTGTIFAADGNGQQAGIEVTAAQAQLQLWRHADLAADGSITLPTGILGYEWDIAPDTGAYSEFRPQGQIKLSSTTVPWNAVLTDFGNTTQPGTLTHNLSLYRDDSGALVFGAGTVFWTWGLSNEHDASPYGGSLVNRNVQQLSVNVLADMGVFAGSLQGDLVSSVSGDTIAATTTLTVDGGITQVQAGQLVTLRGIAVDANGTPQTEDDGIVAAVEVSTDGGASWRVASGTTSWQYDWVATGVGPHVLLARPIDDSVNLTFDGQQLATLMIEVLPAPPPTEFHLFDPSAPPAASVFSDTPGGYELGVSFSASTSGTITAIRYYRAPQDADDEDVLVGNLWSADGTLIASATFVSQPGESGWRSAQFTTPATIEANTSYIASYHNAEFYIGSNGFFDNSHTGPFDYLTAPASTAAQGNGVFAVSASTVFPTQSFLATNYWVDVTFVPSPAGNTAPVIDSASMFDIPENTLVVATIAAHDDDLPVQVLTYSIVALADAGGADGTAFSIDALTGALRFVNAPDFEAPADANGDNTYLVTVRVSDGAGGSARQDIAVTVTDVFDLPPLLANSFAGQLVRAEYVFGGTPNTLIAAAGASQSAIVDASDGAVEFVNLPDASEQDIGNGQFGLARIDVGSTTVRIEFPLDPAVFGGPGVNFAPVASHPFNGVRLSDLGGALSHILGVTIIDQAGFATALTQDHLVVTNDALLLNVSATGSNARLVDADPATDGVQASYVTLSVDFNDAPVITSNGGGESASVTIDSGTTQVATLTAQDADAGQAIEFVLAGEDAALFEVRADQSLHFVTAPEAGALDDADHDGVYELLLVASDGLAADLQSLAISVQQANRAPSALSLAGDEVFENVPDGSVVGVLSAIDPDAGDTATFTLLDDAGGRFAIAAGTGVLSVLAGALLDREAMESHEVTVQVTDAGGLTLERSFAVHVRDVNEFAASAPADTDGAAGGSIDDHAAMGTAVGITAHAQDLDATNNVVTYTLLDDAGGRFAIGNNSGIVTLAGAVDAQVDTTHDITVRASSSDGSSADRMFVVAVTGAPTTITRTLTTFADTFTAATADHHIVDGRAGADVISTRDGNDIIRGNAGNDTLQAGGGDDVLTYLGSGDGFDAVDGGAGFDEIRALGPGTIIGLTSLQDVESIVANGFGGVQVRGSGVADQLDFRTVTLTGVTQIDASGGNDQIIGSTGNDRILGGSGNDALVGHGGNDVILGGSGNDSLQGGEGDDVFLIGTGTGTDVFDGGNGSDAIEASADNAVVGIGGIAGIEAIRGIGYLNVRIVATAAADSLDFSRITLASIALIDGGAGNDTLIGSAGNDILFGNSGTDVLRGGEGDDTLQFSATSLDQFHGDGGMDTLQARAVGSTIVWGNVSGIERVDGGGFAGVAILGASGANTIDLSGAQLLGIARIDGLAGDDTIVGSAGNDVLVGGAGKDVLTGGDGADVFDFNARSESGIGLRFDLITDFEEGSDRIDLLTIDANVLVASSQGFLFIGNAGFHGVAGELRIDVGTPGYTRVLGDADGNGVEDMEIRLVGTHTLAASDFIGLA